jgi:iron complex transport system ATP-binding protein
MLKEGRIVFDGGISEALTPEMLLKVYDFDIGTYSKI